MSDPQTIQAILKKQGALTARTDNGHDIKAHFKRLMKHVHSLVMRNGLYRSVHEEKEFEDEMKRLLNQHVLQDTQIVKHVFRNNPPGFVDGTKLLWKPWKNENGYTSAARLIQISAQAASDDNDDDGLTDNEQDPIDELDFDAFLTPKGGLVSTQTTNPRAKHRLHPLVLWTHEEHFRLSMLLLSVSVWLQELER